MLICVPIRHHLLTTAVLWFYNQDDQHISNDGIPSAVIGICSRYIHTAASIIHVDDYAAAKELLVKLVKSCDKTTIDSIRSNV